MTNSVNEAWLARRPCSPPAALAAPLPAAILSIFCRVTPLVSDFPDSLARVPAETVTASQLVFVATAWKSSQTHPEGNGAVLPHGRSFHTLEPHWEMRS